jgi:hypothetical protein
MVRCCQVHFTTTSRSHIRNAITKIYAKESSVYAHLAKITAIQELTSYRAPEHTDMKGGYKYIKNRLAAKGLQG